MAQILRNNVSSFLTQAISDTATSIVLADGAAFPAPTNGDFFLATLVGLNANGQESSWEIVKCTARAAGTLSVVRAQEGTVARVWDVGTLIQIRLTAATTETKVDEGVVAHEAKADPHPQYLTQTEGDALYSAFAVVTGNTGSASADTRADSIAITGTNGITTSVSDSPDGLVIAPTYGSPTGLAPDGVSSAGTASSFARSDHVHATPTDVAVGLNGGSTSTEGTSTSFARADHTHAVSNGGTPSSVSVTTADQGTSTSLARADHIHSVSTGTPVALASTAAAGTATSLARSDHVHPTTGLSTSNGVETLSNKTIVDPAIIGAILEDVYTIVDGATVDIDPGNGTIQLWTLGANRTPTANNFLSGESVTLLIDDGTAFAITWTTINVIWVGGTAPSLATTGRTIIELWKVETRVYGSFVGTVSS